MEHIDLVFYKLRYLTYLLLIIAGLLMFSLLLSFVSNTEAKATGANTVASLQSTYTPNTANVVTNAAVMAVAKLEQELNSAQNAINSGARSVALTGAQVGKFAVDGCLFMVRSAQHSIAATARAVGSGTITILGFISHTPDVSAVIKPTDHTPIPVIDAPPARLVKQTTPLPAAPSGGQAPQPANPEAVWPIHGEITTTFGVPHWPYQPTHTGLDISDGKAAGITPIKAFKPGKVVETVHSYSGFGNYVIVDHGAGLTSLYGHLFSISVQSGQIVDTATTLGLEGSTGASTGTHLHFEIRVNGQPVNPLQYVSGRP